MAAVAGYTTTLTQAQLQTVNKVWLVLLRDAGLISDPVLQAELARRGKMAFYR